MTLHAYGRFAMARTIIVGSPTEYLPGQMEMFRLKDLYPRARQLVLWPEPKLDGGESAGDDVSAHIPTA